MPMKTCTNLSKKEVLAIEYTNFQLQQRETLLPQCRLRTIVTLLIPRSHFQAFPNPDAHPTFRFSKAVHYNPTTPHNGSQKQMGECLTCGGL